jgi:hypothetical protein
MAQGEAHGATDYGTYLDGLSSGRFIFSSGLLPFPEASGLGNPSN